MKTKALLVGGRSSFKGPRVSLEKGTWLVEPHPFVTVTVVGEGALNSDGRLDGPAVVFAEVSEEYDGRGIFLKAIQETRE